MHLGRMRCARHCTKVPPHIGGNPGAVHLPGGGGRNLGAGSVRNLGADGEAISPHSSSLSRPLPLPPRRPAGAGVGTAVQARCATSVQGPKSNLGADLGAPIYSYPCFGWLPWPPPIARPA